MKKSAYNIKKDDLVPDPVRPVVVGPNLMSPRISTVQQVNQVIHESDLDRDNMLEIVMKI